MALCVRYCGGCNPEYDRVALVGALEEATGWSAGYGEPSPGDVCLLVSGCSRSCAGPADTPCRYIRVNRLWDVGRLAEEIKKEAATSCAQIQKNT